MKRLILFSIPVLIVFVTACMTAGASSGICSAAGGCAPRHPDAQVLSSATPNVWGDEHVGNLSENRGLPDIRPDTVCEAAVYEARVDGIQDVISKVMADKRWENISGWTGGSVWRSDHTYAFIRTWPLDPEDEMVGVQQNPSENTLDTLGVTQSDLQNYHTLSVTCVFDQPPD